MLLQESQGLRGVKTLPETNSNSTRKWMVGRDRFLLVDGLFSGADSLLVSGRLSVFGCQGESWFQIDLPKLRLYKLAGGDATKTWWMFV